MQDSPSSSSARTPLKQQQTQSATALATTASPQATPPATATTAAASQSLADLFAPPPPPPAAAVPKPTPPTERALTERVSNERTALLSSQEQQQQKQQSPWDVSSSFSLSNPAQRASATWDDENAFANLKAQAKKQVRLTNNAATSSRDNDSSALSLSCWQNTFWKHRIVQAIVQPTTIAGALMFLLYHVVFVLALGSALMRPHASTRPILGVMTKLTTVGIVSAGPLYVYRLNADVPAVYPSVDLFLAPFLAQAVAIVDESLWQQYNNNSNNMSNGDESYPDEIFFGSFAVLTSMGMFMAGIFLWLGSRFKLANLGTYLPFSVLSGFFSAVGILLWCLAFSVDTGGQTWKQVFLGSGGDVAVISRACLHHAPSLVMGIIMNRLGPKNPFYVIGLILVTIATFYISFYITGTTLQEAQRDGWFWSLEELVYDHRNENDHTTIYDTTTTTPVVPHWLLPPAPFGSFGAIWARHVNWKAVQAGLGNMAGLSFLYLLRSSIHASAMKKNVSNLVRRIPIKRQSTPVPPSSVKTINTTETAVGDGGARTTTASAANAAPTTTSNAPTTLERLGESIRIVHMSMKDKQELGPAENGAISSASTTTAPRFIEIRAKAPRRSLESIFSEYAYALFVVAFVGGFGVCPTVATSNTMYAIGAEAPAPQYGSIFLLVVFYLLDFRMVQYIPKTAFSSLLVLGAVDTLVVWFFGAFRKTQDIAEWLVVPLIAGLSLFVGFLNAVFLGIGISMFVFVASFFRIGVVKYSASGLEIRSRIERSVAQSGWLNENGDLCQVIVLQNYLFFGNACTILEYIATMFEDVDISQSQRLGFSLPPFPKILVVDLSLVTGMDTSTVDIFGEILEFCKNNDCKLFLCGLSLRMKRGLELGGVKPDTGPRSQSSVRFFSDLDTALGRAEDSLIKTEMNIDSGKSLPLRQFRSSESLDDGRGFHRALKQIDELHGLDFTKSLLDLQRYMQLIELEPGICLYQCDGGVVEESQRGLFFIEEGLLKIERDSSQSLTLTRTRGSVGVGSRFTLGNQHARMGSVARRTALAKGGNKSTPGNLRLARLGPGWVCGTLESAAGVQSSGITVAVTKCRLHHLSLKTLDKLEEDDPALVLRLYKLVTHLRAYREEATIEQLTTLNNIMTSPAHSKPISRAARRALGP